MSGHGADAFLQITFSSMLEINPAREMHCALALAP
jgi:hypothetical protein